MIQSIGLDLGSQKTILITHDGERILTSTGSVTRPSIVLFNQRSRLAGEEASPEMMSDNMLSFLSELYGKSYQEVETADFLKYTKLRLTGSSDGLVNARVSYNGEEKEVSMTSVLAIFLAQLVTEISMTKLPILAFPLPHGYTPSMERAIKEACMIAGISTLPRDPVEASPTRIVILDSADCLARAYTRKLSAIKGIESSQIEGHHVVILEMGHVHTTVLVVQPQDNLQSVQIKAVQHSSHIGAFHLDSAIYAYLADIIEKKHHCQVEPGTKKGLRLMRECERLRKLLSQLPSASVTIENISDGGDVTVSMTRDELARICQEPLQKLNDLINSAITDYREDIVAVEIVGGGVRMSMVQEMLLTAIGKELPLGAKLDDGSIAVGAALLALEKAEKEKTDIDELMKSVMAGAEVNTSSPVEGAEIESANEPISPPLSEPIPSFGLSDDGILAARQDEILMQMNDQEIRELLSSRNEMEGYILDMRGVPNRKHGQSVDREALRVTLEIKENWLWENGETATLSDLKREFSQLKDQIEGQCVPESPAESSPSPPLSGNDLPVIQSKKQRVGGICSEYMNLVEVDRIKLEEALAADAALAAEQRAAEGEDEDHDFRKLKKADRMRLVVKNKDEGTELFKGGNIRPAAARYQKALSHAAKFFDLSPEDTEEVDQVKLSIHLNLAQCYLKLENWDNAIKYSGEALTISPTSAKAFFRRSAAYESKKEYEKALEDLKQASTHTPGEDKAIVKSMDRVKKSIQKEKDKEKKMWGKAFAS